MRSLGHVGALEGCILLLIYHTCSAVEVTVPSSVTALYHTRTLLPCTFTVNNPPIDPKFLVIFWHFEGTQLVKYNNKDKFTRPGVSIDEQEVQRGNAALSIHNVTISDHGTYSCLVIYSPDRKEKKIQLNIQAVPVVKILKKILARNEKNQVQCSVTDFYPRDIKVTWMRDRVPLTGSISETFEKNDEGTFSVNSSVTITAAEAENNPIITCQVEHESLEDTIQDSFKVEYGASPTVQFTSSKTSDGEELIYVCEARGYFPEALEINWLLDGKRTGSPKTSDDGLFNKQIFYRIDPSKGNRPTQISCEVQHETLVNPITETLQVKLFDDCTRTCNYTLFVIFLVLAILGIGILAAGWYIIIQKKYFLRFQVSPIHKELININKEEVTLYCTASNCEKDVKVTWTITEEGGEPVTISEMNRDEENVELANNYSVRTDRSQSPTDKLHNVLTALRYKTTGKSQQVTCRFHCGHRSQERTYKLKTTASTSSSEYINQG